MAEAEERAREMFKHPRQKTKGKGVMSGRERTAQQDLERKTVGKKLGRAPGSKNRQKQEAG